MKPTHYKYLAVTFFITTIWSVYVFFDYFAEEETNSFKKLTLFFDYVFSIVPVLLLSLILLSLRFTKYGRWIKGSFLYTFAAFFNLFLFSVYMVYLVFAHLVKEFFTDSDWITLMVCSAFLVGTGFIADIYKTGIYEDNLVVR